MTNANALTNVNATMNTNVIVYAIAALPSALAGTPLANAIVIQLLNLLSMLRLISKLSMLRSIKDPSPTNANATINANAMTNAIASIHSNVIVNANAFVHAMLAEILTVLNYMKDTGEIFKKFSDTTQSSN